MLVLSSEATLLWLEGRSEVVCNEENVCAFPSGLKTGESGVGGESEAVVAPRPSLSVKKNPRCSRKLLVTFDRTLRQTCSNFDTMLRL